MRLVILQGRLCLFAETPRDGYDIGRLRTEAELVGKHLKIEGNGNGVVAAVVPLHDIDLARAFGAEEGDEA